jgi:hypothetical protein
MSGIVKMDYEVVTKDSAIIVLAWRARVTSVGIQGASTYRRFPTIGNLTATRLHVA